MGSIDVFAGVNQDRFDRKVSRSDNRLQSFHDVNRNETKSGCSYRNIRECVLNGPSSKINRQNTETPHVANRQMCLASGGPDHEVSCGVRKYRDFRTEISL